jgi:hypothetical protein
MAPVFTETNRKALLKELRAKLRVCVEGLNFDPAIFQNIDLGNTVIERVNNLFAIDKHPHSELEFPEVFVTPLGRFRVPVSWNKKSPLTLEYEDGQFNIHDHEGDREKILFEKLEFPKRPDYYARKTSDGTDMRTVAVDSGYGAMFVAYSNECSLKDNGRDCLFCNINATKAIYGESQGISWKTPKQVGETIGAGYGIGFDHVTISGGFVPERREVEYYIDAAEEIRQATGLDDFNGTACVGAPSDLDVFEKYKEAGYRTIATNMEVWNEKMFDVICPGKSLECGGRKNWLAALETEVAIFGKNRVRSTFVSGLEPKEYLLEGAEELTSKGVLPCINQWNVNVGSPLEGHRTPTEEWHWDVFERVVAIYRKYGVKWNELRDANAGVDTVPFDLFRIYENIDVENQVKY